MSDKQQHDTDLNIAQQARWDDLLKDYRDGIDTLLLTQDLRHSQPGQDVREIAHSRTLDVLDAVDATHRKDVFFYLYHLHLIQTSLEDINGNVHQQMPIGIVSLFCANLSDINLSGASLFDVDLDGADLSGANLSEAILSKVNLSKASVFETNLDTADLTGANLTGANLARADLSHAYLQNADLFGAVITIDQLKAVDSLSGTTLPNGFVCQHELNVNDFRERVREQQHVKEDCLTHFNDTPIQHQ